MNFRDIVIYRCEGSCIILCLEEIKDRESWIVEIDMRYKVVLSESVSRIGHCLIVQLINDSCVLIP